MAIERETLRVGGLVGITLGAGLLLGAGYTGALAYNEVDNCDRDSVDCSQEIVAAYQKSGDAATLPFWSGIGIIALSAVAVTIGER